MQLTANDLTDLKLPACKGAGGRGEALKYKIKRMTGGWEEDQANLIDF